MSSRASFEQWEKDYKDQHDGAAPPKLMTPWGPVTEYARKQAAENIKADPELKQRVMEVLLKQVSKPKPEEELTEEELKAWEEKNKELAEEAFKERYPEAL